MTWNTDIFYGERHVINVRAQNNADVWKTPYLDMKIWTLEVYMIILMHTQIHPLFLAYRL